MRKITESYIRYIVIEDNKLEFFIFLNLLYVLSAILVNEFIIHDELYYRSFGNQLSINAIDSLISFRNTWKWLSYATIPLILTLKFLLVATFLSMGSIVASHKLTFRQIFGITMACEVVFLTANFITTGNLLFSEVNTLEDLSVTMFSLASMIPESSIETYLYVPLQSFNVFLLVYIFFLSWCYKTVTGYPFNQSLILILATYGSAFIMWIILIMYLLISYA
ncbi:MAG: hypothetical protein ACFCUM_18505 [Bacteroidales bacterium]